MVEMKQGLDGVAEQGDAITLADGTTMQLPKLTNGKLIGIARFMAMDGMKVFQDFREEYDGQEMTQMEAGLAIMEKLTDKQIVHILSVLLGKSDAEMIDMNPIDTLEIIQAYAEKNDIAKAFTIVRSLTSKFSNQQVPDKQQTAAQPMTTTAG